MRSKQCNNQSPDSLSERELEERKLRTETNGIYAPAKPGFFAERRKELVEKYVKEGLKKFDENQTSNDRIDSLTF